MEWKCYLWYEAFRDLKLFSFWTSHCNRRTFQHLTACHGWPCWPKSNVNGDDTDNDYNGDNDDNDDTDDYYNDDNDDTVDD